MNQITVRKPTSIARQSVAADLEAATRPALAAVSTLLTAELHRPEGREDYARAIKVLQDTSAPAIAAAFAQARAPATPHEIGAELTRLVAAYPSAARAELGPYGAVLAEDVANARPSRFAIQCACRTLRTEAKWLPSVAEILAAIAEEERHLGNKASLLADIPRRITEATKQLAYAGTLYPENQP